MLGVSGRLKGGHDMPNITRDTAPADLPATGYVRLALLLQLIPMSRSSIWRKTKAGTFPKPYKLSDNVTAWRAEDVRDWIEAQHAQTATSTGRG